MSYWNYRGERGRGVFIQSESGCIRVEVYSDPLIDPIIATSFSKRIRVVNNSAKDITLKLKSGSHISISHKKKDGKQRLEIITPEEISIRVFRITNEPKLSNERDRNEDLSQTTEYDPVIIPPQEAYPTG